MYYFLNDYSEGCLPEVMEALVQTNMESTPGYGLDPYCAKAADRIRTRFACPDAAVHFLVGGTQTNFTAISAFLRPWALYGVFTQKPPKMRLYLVVLRLFRGGFLHRFFCCRFGFGQFRSFIGIFTAVIFDVGGFFIIVVRHTRHCHNAVAFADTHHPHTILSMSKLQQRKRTIITVQTSQVSMCLGELVRLVLWHLTEEGLSKDL